MNNLLQLELKNKKILLDLKNEVSQRHVGEYFTILQFDQKYFLYYLGYGGTIKLVISDNLNFNDCEAIEVMKYSHSCFCIIKYENHLLMLCGAHQTTGDKTDVTIPNLVWPKKPRLVGCPTIYNNEYKNGMYLFKSDNGILWDRISEKPVLHSVIETNTIKLGEVCFDTSPALIKFQNKFYYYGRLNTSLDERNIYCRISNDMINWEAPIKINIVNENMNNLKKNYYLFTVFQVDEILYALTPYFEACGTEARRCTNGQTLLLKSSNGIDWTIIKYCLKHTGKYLHRANDTLVDESKLLVFYRDYIQLDNQQLSYYEMIL